MAHDVPRSPLRMFMPLVDSPEAQQARPADAEPSAIHRRREGWGRTLVLGLVLLFVFLGNHRATIGTYDTISNELLPYVLIRGGGPFLDSFLPFLVSSRGELPDFATRSQGHVLSRHPIGAAILAIPLYLPQIAYLDYFEPDWEHTGPRVVWYCTRMAKNASAVIAVATALVLYRLLWALGLGRVAIPSVLAAALGSNLWAVASQAPWQHGPAALTLTLIMFLLLPHPTPRWRLVLAGAATGALVAVRLIDVVFAAAIVVGLTFAQPRGLLWFLPPAVPIVGALLGYNLWYFGTLVGGQSQLEALHPIVHGVRGVWTGDFLEGAAGTLLSPNRGLFVFSPWVALAVLFLPRSAHRLKAYPIIACLFASLVPYFLMLSKYSVWWAGHSFGPRYWTDAIPLFAIPLALALDWCRRRFRAALFVFAPAIVWAVGVQAIGAFHYPSSWNWLPANVDRHHERLWDWYDSELARCLREGPKAW